MGAETSEYVTRYEPSVTEATRKIERSRRLLPWSYVAAVCVAALVFLCPIPVIWARFGANLILFPTIVTGLHVWFLNKQNSTLAPIHKGMGEGLGTINVEYNQLTKTVEQAMGNIPAQVRSVIIYETVLASLGTGLWAYGDLIWKGAK